MLQKYAPNHLRHSNSLDSVWITDEDEKNHSLMDVLIIYFETLKDRCRHNSIWVKPQKICPYQLVMDKMNTSFIDWSVTFFVKKALELFEVSVYIFASALTVNAVCWKVRGIYTVEIMFPKSLPRRHKPFSYLTGCAETFQKHEEYLSVLSQPQLCASVHLA